MARKNRQFPLVADDESVIAAAPQMHLYDNEDLINNIHGDYQDKTFQDQPDNDTSTVTASKRGQSPLSDRKAGQSYAELARQEAKQDLKRKRQSFIAKEAKLPSKPSFQRRESAGTITKSTNSKPTLFFNGRLADASQDLPNNELARFSKNLHQDHYILAELPRVYKEPKNPSTKQSQKNSYDFLKRSQIYNQEESRQRRTHQIAKELNLMMDEE
ncbi:hypothetical protein [Streptococcus tangpeifui]|uniref:hypothetical protein n=1 Tax=Streptococcus tangpeifui TaxID=2709400 RepID=UPI0013EE261F|nr:hypothetical protein [Streptococcus sp. ZJ373]